jgi:hypothetical protein
MADISPNFGQSGSLFIHPTVSILWNVLSSMLLRRVRALSRVIASLIVMKWKRAYR